MRVKVKHCKTNENVEKVKKCHKKSKAHVSYYLKNVMADYISCRKFIIIMIKQTCARMRFKTKTI